MNDCPKCGCNDVSTAGRAMRWGKPWNKFRCNHCGRTWSAAPPEKPEHSQRAPLPSVDYPIITCPHCRSDRTKVTSTRSPERYHTCSDCGENFKSYEKR